MDALIAALHFTVGHKIIVMMLLMGGVAAAVSILRPRARRWLPVAAPLALLAFGNMFAGDRLLGWLLQRYGAEGTGTVVSIEDTSSRLNGRTVKRYAALIRTADGRTVETGFDSFAMPVYPVPGNGYSVPTPGTVFGVRHLRSRPQVFSIVTDDDSAYAKSLRCVDLAKAMNEARAKAQFDPASADYRLAHAQAMSAYARADCIGNERMSAQMLRQAASLQRPSDPQGGR